MDAPIHNPSSLTPAQYGAPVYRLLTSAELKNVPRYTEMWDEGEWVKLDIFDHYTDEELNGFRGAGREDMTYRVHVHSPYEDGWFKAAILMPTEADLPIWTSFNGARPHIDDCFPFGQTWGFTHWKRAKVPAPPRL